MITGGTTYEEVDTQQPFAVNIAHLSDADAQAGDSAGDWAVASCRKYDRKAVQKLLPLPL